MKILIVDDNEDARMILKKTLESDGYTVKVATNGKEALKAAKESPPDIIISDILMPVMDGFTLCREWKGDECLKEIPFVFYTATYTDPKDEELALGLGAERFIVKPVEPDKFMEIIQGVIRDMERGRVRHGKPDLEGEREVLKIYSERLVKKLEKKMLDLEKEINERKQAEEALRKSEEFTKKIIESSIDCIKILDLDGRLKFMNLGGQELLEIEDIGPYLNQLWVDFWKDPDRKAALEAISKAGAGETGSFQGYCPTEKGTPKWWDVIITPIQGKDGGVEELLAISRDITKSRQAEQRMNEGGSARFSGGDRFSGQPETGLGQRDHVPLNGL
ncbi:MAG: response regulator [Pseudomonadota bacterium]